MSSTPPTHEPIDPAPRVFTVGMERAEMYRITMTMDPKERVHFWSTFQSTAEVAFPSAATSRVVDDIAAVLSGSKPATIVSPEEAGEPSVNDLIEEENDRFNALSTAEAFDHYGGLKLFWGKPDSVSALANLYAGRGGADSPIPADESFHRAVGKALGYPPAAIDAFVERISSQDEYDRRKGKFGKFLGKLSTER